MLLIIMKSMRDFIKEVVARTPELDRQLEEVKTQRARIDAELEPEPSDMVYDSVTGTYFISPVAELIKYLDLKDF